MNKCHKRKSKCEKINPSSLTLSPSSVQVGQNLTITLQLNHTTFEKICKTKPKVKCSSKCKCSLKKDGMGNLVPKFANIIFPTVGGFLPPITVPILHTKEGMGTFGSN